MKILSGKLRFLIVIVSMVIFTAMIFPETVDYLKTGNTLEFNKDKYNLSWSSHPSANYYKQEYLKSGEQMPGYHNMLLLESIDDEMKISEVLKTKVN